MQTQNYATTNREVTHMSHNIHSIIVTTSIVNLSTFIFFRNLVLATPPAEIHQTCQDLLASIL